MQISLSDLSFSEASVRIYIPLTQNFRQMDWTQQSVNELWLLANFAWVQGYNCFSALIQNPVWSKQLDSDRERPLSEQVLLD